MARTSTDICVSIVRDPALVRTVRLVAAAVARRASGDEDLVEEVRLAVGEACALLVGIGDEPAVAAGAHAGLNGRRGTSEHWVEVTMTWSDRLRAVVRSPGPPAPPDTSSEVDPWSLLRGLIADLDISSEDDGTTLTMSWPLG